LQAAFEQPRTVDDAVALLAAHGQDARALAGGTDLLVQMRGGARTPALLVDLKRIGELTAVTIGPDEIAIGAACSTASLRENEALVALLPGLLEAAELIGSEQIQGRSSLGGNLCNASPAADSVPALVADRAVCEIAGPGGRRRLPVAQFPTGPGETALAPGEILVSLHLPHPGPRAADAYLRFIPRSEMDIAVVGASAFVRLDPDGGCEAARLALGAVGPTVIDAADAAATLVGGPIDAAALERVAAAARAAARPIDDKRGTAAYRRHVAGVLARRTVEIAARRAAERS